MSIVKVRIHFEAILALCRKYKITVVLPDKLALRKCTVWNPLPDAIPS